MYFDFQELGRKLGRRAHKRFIIPGAVLSWKLEVQDGYSNPKLPMSDISQGGLSFLADNPPSVESDIFVKIWLPPRKLETLELTGKVKYSIPRGPSLTYGYRIGVELRSFEEKDGSNSLQKLAKIEALEKKYGFAE
jgi:hypothetical protein